MLVYRALLSQSCVCAMCESRLCACVRVLERETEPETTETETETEPETETERGGSSAKEASLRKAL